MKLIFITEELNERNGWGRYSIDLCRALIKAGEDVVVICHKGNKEIDDIRQFEVLPSSLSFKKNYFFAILYLIKFYFKFGLTEFDKVHVVVETYTFFGFLLAKTRLKPYFLTIHGSFGLKTFINPIIGFIQGVCYKMANKIIVVSNYTNQRVLELINLKNTIVINNGVSSGLFNYGRSEVVKDSFTVLGVGGLVTRKGFHLSLEVINIVRDEILNLKYKIVAGNKTESYYQELIKIIKKYELQDIVSIDVGISDQDLICAYKGADIFMLTPISSKYDFEGFGLVYLEAGAFGLPVIGTFGNGGEDAILNGETGFLVEPDNIKEIAKKLVSLYKDKELYRSMSNKSLNHSREMIWDRVVEKYLKVYRQ